MLYSRANHIFVRHSRLCPFIQNVQIPLVGKHPFAAFVGEFVQDSEVHECLHVPCGGGEAHAGLLGEKADGGHGAAAQCVEQVQGIGGAASERAHLHGVLLKEGEQAVRGVHCAGSGLLDAFEKEIQPRFPVAGVAHGVELAVVLGAVLFEIQREVQERLAQHAVVMQDQGDEEPSHAPVAIQKRVDGFELHVRERRLDERPGASGACR